MGIKKINPERKSKRWVNLGIMFFNEKPQRISLKNSEQPGKSLYARDKAEKIYWMAVIFKLFRQHCVKNKHSFLWEITALSVSTNH